MKFATEPFAYIVEAQTEMPLLNPGIPVTPVQRQRLVKSLVVGIQGQKAYGLS